MQIVIDLPKYVYDTIIACGGYISDCDNEKVGNAIKDSTPLSSSENSNKWIDADVFDKIRTEIMDINVVRDEYSQRQNDYCDDVEFAKRYVLQIIDKYKASPTGAESEE